uniref:ARAD1B16610p n=1 Tax=Blastobotrys adeninivorans TaxID=409370 RepID=A0A060T6L6_BLAAD
MLTLPPLTRVLLLLLITVSVAAAVLRHVAYWNLVKSINEADKEQWEKAFSEEITHGVNFPPRQKTVDEVVQISDLYVPVLTLVPGYSPLYFLWIWITTSFVEDGVISGITSAMVLIYGGRYCEHVWGARELLRFVLIATLVPNILCFALYSLRYQVWTPDTVHKVQTICGASSLIAGFLVAFKQLVPEHCIVLFRGRIRVRVKHLPFIYLVVTCFLGIFGHGLLLLQCWTGFFVSWVYLRFLRVTYVDPMLPTTATAASTAGAGVYEHDNPSGIRIKGDASDSFAFARFFPEPFCVPVGAAADWVYAIVVALRLCTPFTAAEVDGANLRAAARLSSFQNAHILPSSAGIIGDEAPKTNPRPSRSARAEAERRRALALRALGDRLSVDQSADAYHHHHHSLPTMPAPAYPR